MSSRVGGPADAPFPPDLLLSAKRLAPACERSSVARCLPGDGILPTGLWTQSLTLTRERTLV